MEAMVPELPDLLRPMALDDMDMMVCSMAIGWHGEVQKYRGERERV